MDETSFMRKIYVININGNNLEKNLDPKKGPNEIFQFFYV